MFDILTYLPAKRKQTPSGWQSFNAPCCGDKRGRGGIKVSTQGWSYHCFNCQSKASFTLGRPVSFKAKRLLELLGVPEHDIEILNLESLKHKSIHGILDDRQRVMNELSDVHFEEFLEFPPNVELIDPNNSVHRPYWDYVMSRKAPEDFPFMVQTENDGVHWTRPHVILPFTYEGTTIGWSARMLDNKQPRFISHSQPGYVFGVDLQKSDWQHVIVVEGLFDALSISGLAVMTNNISDLQAKLVRNLGKDITVVPDQDKAGLELIDRAMELNWPVSIPDWPSDIKDVNDAVIRFGKARTLLDIFDARETSKLKIELRKRQLVKKLGV